MGNGFFSGNIKIQEVNNFRFIGWAFIVYFFYFDFTPLDYDFTSKNLPLPVEA